jgi:quercetin dioxygenase-like cupin family protein
MEAQSTLKVICKHYQDGEVTDVSGLNRVTILVDRTQASLTEVGWNYWPAGTEGPPHFHDGKEQMFFATQGTAVVTIAGEAFRLDTNGLLHVPHGTMHRTILPAGSGDHAYFLFNAFRDWTREGQPSWSVHIDKARHERRRQADAAAQGAPIDWSQRRGSGRLVHIDTALPQDGQGLVVEPLLERLPQHRAAADLIRAASGQGGPFEFRPGTEKTLFVVAGAGRLTADGHAYRLESGTMVYLPAAVPASAEAGAGGLVVLSLSTYLD